MPHIYFFIPGKPVGKARPRMTKTGHCYTPANTRDYEKLVAKCAAEAMGGMPLADGPVTTKMRVRLPIPKSTSAKKRNVMINGQCMKKPDIDNVVKSVMDGLTGVVWQDDKQVTRLVAHKGYDPDDGYGTGVTVDVCWDDTVAVTWAETKGANDA